MHNNMDLLYSCKWGQDHCSFKHNMSQCLHPSHIVAWSQFHAFLAQIFLCLSDDQRTTLFDETIGGKRTLGLEANS